MKNEKSFFIFIFSFAKILRGRGIDKEQGSK